MTDDKLKFAQALDIVWKLAQVLGIVLFALLSFFCNKIYATVEENGKTLIEVQTVQKGVVKSLDSIDTQVRGTITRVEHDALALRVTAAETAIAAMSARMDPVTRNK